MYREVKNIHIKILTEEKRSGSDKSAIKSLLFPEIAPEKNARDAIMDKTINVKKIIVPSTVYAPRRLQKPAYL
jgi:hypothetical protein